MVNVKIRLLQPRLSPRRTRIEVPGWGGTKEPRRNGAHEQGWHCLPFVEGAQYGIELFYPHDREVRVSRRDGQFAFEGGGDPNPETGMNWPPFRPFGEGYYTYQLLLDVKVPEGYAVRTEPHPRFYLSEAGDVPLAVPALLRTSWWPMINFVVFKAPPPGGVHVFRPGEPFMQLCVVPAEPEVTLEAMNAEEAAEREMQSRRIHASRDTLGRDTQWTSSTNTVFDGTYRRILGAAKARDRATED
ncbi:hypothetical protein [Paraburkholderia acidipaludis]|uniref:hypothetical protein n=1 Tax=Paraburkholderia acidipaludis TaxID=660537 RepID=UPI0004857C48|nr:hypothetical protein [Paraburkholderia acidipaludis]